MAKLEEEEETGCFWNHTTKKGAHMYHHFVMSSSWPFGEIVHNSPRVVFLGEMSRVSCVLFIIRR